MKRAICLPYAVDQNEPSVPLKQIISLPDDVKQRNKILKKLFVEHVCEVPLQELTVTERSDENDFGDLIVTRYAEHDVFMYVTFIEEG